MSVIRRAAGAAALHVSQRASASSTRTARNVHTSSIVGSSRQQHKIRAIHQHAQQQPTTNSSNSRQAALAAARAAALASSSSSKRVRPWRLSAAPATASSRQPKGNLQKDRQQIDLHNKSHPSTSSARLQDPDPEYILYDNDFLDDDFENLANFSTQEKVYQTSLEATTLNHQEDKRQEAASSEIALNEDHLAFGRGQSRRSASKTILNGGMTQQDKAERKHYLETVAMQQGVTVLQAETKRLKREDAARRQKRKSYLLRLQPYIERNLQLVELEAEEDRRIIEEQKTWSDARLLREGIMLKGLEGYWQQNNGVGSGSSTMDDLSASSPPSTSANSSLSSRTAVLHRPGKAKLGWTRIQKGDQVALRPNLQSRDGENDALDTSNPAIATVRFISEYEVRLAFRDPPADLDLLAHPTWRIDIAYNDTIEARLRGAVEAVAHDVGATQRSGVELSGTYLVDVLQESGRRGKAPSEDQAPIGEWIKKYRPNKSAPNLDMLTESQRTAVDLMLNERLSLIQGPPGTGKTSTIVSAIKLLKLHYDIPHPILLTSHTNVAVDNLAQGCKEAGLHVVRAGPSARVREAIIDVTLEGRIEQHPLRKRLSDIESIRAATLHALQGEQSRRRSNEQREAQAMQRPSMDEAQDGLYGMSVNELDGGDRVTQHAPKSTKQPLSVSALQKRLSRMNQQAFLLRRQMETDIFAQADVVCCTALSVPLIRAIDFPIVFFDEATMATEPITLATITKGCQQLSLIGDHKQLSPLIRSRDANAKGLGESMFERLMARGDLKTVMLDTQHRMHPSLAEFSGTEFYDGKLRSGEATWQMEPLSSSFVPIKKTSEGRDSFLTFVHHNGRESVAKSKSLENQAEAELVVSIVADLLVRNKDLNGADIAILTPYAGQRELFARSLTEAGSPLRKHFARQLERRGGAEAKARIRELSKLEVETIDGFEGREKRAIVFSMVRNNTARLWGFLSEHKRWNVALTRARNGLWIVGSMPMMEQRSVRELMEERQQSQLNAANAKAVGEPLSAGVKDADEEDGVKEVRIWRPVNGQHAGFITRFAAHLRKHGCVLDAGNVL